MVGGWAPIQQLVSNLLLWNQDLVHILQISFFPHSLHRSARNTHVEPSVGESSLCRGSEVSCRLTPRHRFKTLGEYLETADDDDDDEEEEEEEEEEAASQRAR